MKIDGKIQLSRAHVEKCSKLSTDDLEITLKIR